MRRLGLLRIVRAAGLVISILSLTGCVAPPQPVCSPGSGSAMLAFNLFFGSAIPGRDDLTEQQWQTFLEDTITTNLPNGFTVLNAAGAWMNPVTRRTIHEASRVVVAALPASPDSLAAINRVRAEYQVRFHQQLAGLTVTRACGSF